MRLYEISERYKNIADLLQSDEFAENPDLLNALDNIEDEFETKVQQTIFIMRNIEAEIDPIDAEIKRLQAMKKTRQNAIERIKNRLKINLQAIGIHKVNCGLFSVTYRENEQGAVEIDEDLFLANNCDEDFVNVKITPNKSAIKLALRNGEEITGAKLVSSQSLTIR